MMCNTKNLGRSLLNVSLCGRRREVHGIKKLQDKISLEKVTCEKSTQLFQKLLLPESFYVFSLVKISGNYKKGKAKMKERKKKHCVKCVQIRSFFWSKYRKI